MYRSRATEGEFYENHKVKRREELRNVELLKEEKEVVAEPKKEDTASVNSNILLKYNFL